MPRWKEMTFRSLTAVPSLQAKVITTTYGCLSLPLIYSGRIPQLYVNDYGNYSESAWELIMGDLIAALVWRTN